MSEWIEPRHEPPLVEMLADPIIRILMARDCIGPDEILELLERIDTDSRETAFAAA